MAKKAKSRIIPVRLISMAMTGYFKTYFRPRTKHPLGMMRYDPVGFFGYFTFDYFFDIRKLLDVKALFDHSVSLGELGDDLDNPGDPEGESSDQVENVDEHDEEEMDMNIKEEPEE